MATFKTKIRVIKKDKGYWKIKSRMAQMTRNICKFSDIIYVEFDFSTLTYYVTERNFNQLQHKLIRVFVCPNQHPLPTVWAFISKRLQGNSS